MASSVTSLHSCRGFSCPLGFCRQTGVPFRAFAQTIDRLTEPAQLTAQSLGEVDQGQVIFIPNEKGYHLTPLSNRP